MKMLFQQVTTRVILALTVIGMTSGAVICAHEGHSKPAPTTGAGNDELSERGGLPAKYVPLKNQPPHAGQVFSTQWQSLEVVYLPHETRVYLFNYTEKPMTARGASGEVIMQVTGNPQFFRYPLRYVAQTPGSAEQDYLAAQVDVSQIRNGDMRVYFDLLHLPYAQEPKLRFDQVFALAGGAPTVTVVPFTAADRAAVARQGSCPVMETGFDHGDPIKLMIGDQVIFVCCEDCIEAIKKSPETYLAKTASALQATREAARLRQTRPGSSTSKCSKGCCK